MAEDIDRWPVLAAGAASSKKAIDPVVLAVGDVLAITDHFVIASGSNPRQVRTIAEEIERQITDAGGPKPLRTEGLDDLAVGAARLRRLRRARLPRRGPSLLRARAAVVGRAPRRMGG